MARPITLTPALSPKSMKKLTAKVEKNLGRPTTLVPTPKIDNIIKIIKANAQDSQK